MAIFAGSLAIAQEDEFLGYKVNGKAVETLADAAPLIEELKKLQSIEDYEVEVDFCVAYGDSNQSPEIDNLDSILRAQGFSISIEGIYGDAGNHMIEVYEHPAGKYLGAFAGVYSCD